MLKLLKYDFKSNWKMLLRMIGIIICMAIILSNIIFKDIFFIDEFYGPDASMNTMDGYLEYIISEKSIGPIVFGALAIALVVLYIINSIKIIEEDLKGNYLLYSLPIETYKIIISRIIGIFFIGIILMVMMVFLSLIPVEGLLNASSIAFKSPFTSGASIILLLVISSMVFGMIVAMIKINGKDIWWPSITGGSLLIVKIFHNLFYVFNWNSLLTLSRNGIGRLDIGRRLDYKNQIYFIFNKTKYYNLENILFILFFISLFIVFSNYILDKKVDL